MTDSVNEPSQSASEVFSWHPEYVGRSYESVHRDLTDDIRRDQEAYDAVLNEAEKEEFGAFHSIRELEKRWSDYDFGWHEVRPESLADRILQFERARDARKELISWQEWKSQATPQPGVTQVSEQKPDWRENLTDDQRRKLASGLSVLVLVGMVVVCVLIYMLVT